MDFNLTSSSETMNDTNMPPRNLVQWLRVVKRVAGVFGGKDTERTGTMADFIQRFLLYRKNKSIRSICGDGTPSRSIILWGVKEPVKLFFVL